MAGLGLLVSAYKRLTGLGMSPQYFALARSWTIALLVVILAAFAVLLLVDDEPVVTAATAVVVFVATVVLGRRADTVVAVADSVTSKQLKVLTEAGYVKLSKPTGTGGRAKTWATLTPTGRRAFEGHLPCCR